MLNDGLSKDNQPLNEDTQTSLNQTDLPQTLRSGFTRRLELKLDSDLQKTSRILLLVFFLGWFAVSARSLLLSVGASRAIGEVELWYWLGLGFASFLWSLAWLAGGFLLGFIFGVPKVVSQSVTPPVNPPIAAVSVEKSPRLRVNTNLEEISDWLTKILVGATLTQLIRIPAAIHKVAAFMAKGDTSLGAEPFNAAIVVYYGALGFLSGYIITRIFFARAFAEADNPENPD